MRLITVAHGTRHLPGNQVARELTAAAQRTLGMPATTAYVELCAPLLGEALAAGREPALVVPLLLSTGYHVRHDLPAALRESGADARLAPHLGPDPALARAQAARLREAGARRDRPVVMVAAGSSDPLAAHDLASAAGYLAEVWGGEVRLATLSAQGQRLEEVAEPGCSVSPYLLAPGFFADRCRREALAAGAGTVAGVIGPHPLAVDLLVRRVWSATRARAA